MKGRIAGKQPTGLERLCDFAARDGFRTARIAPGFERLEAYFSGRGYDPHRHDSYAIGLTLSGVQTTDYRGQTTHSRPGQVIVSTPTNRMSGVREPARAFITACSIPSRAIFSARSTGGRGRFPLCATESLPTRG